MLMDYFSGEKDLVLKNIGTLESYFDCWCRIDGFDDPTSFLESCLSHEHMEGKDWIVGIHILHAKMRHMS